MDALGIGIVGGGTAALDICRAIDALPAVHLAAIHDRVASVAADLAGPRGAAVHGDVDALLADPSVHIVYVALPHDLLARVAERALGSGKHALVEKPMALEPEAIARLTAIAREQDRTVGVVFQLREHGTTRIASRLLRDGAIGRVTAIRIETVIDKPDAYWRSGLIGRTVDDWRSHRARAGGGVVLMNAIHQIDLVRHLTGLSFTGAAAATATLRARVDVEDAAAAALTLSNGGLASIVATAHSSGARDQERIEFDGSLGRIDVPDPDGNEPVRMFLRRPWREHPAGQWLSFEPPTVDSYVEFMRLYVRAVRTGTPPPATAGDAAAALATVLAIYRSAETGRSVAIEPSVLDASTAPARR